MHEARQDFQGASGDGSRGIFERPAKTFIFDPKGVEWILADAANPLNQIVRIVPARAKVLDIGAGNGILARLFAALGKEVTVDAVEPDPVALELAAPLYRSIFAGGLETYLKTASAGGLRYDFIIMADILEHLADPEPLLRGLKGLLSPSGSILLSTPNIAFASVRLALLNGRFDYADSGIVERTHLRFYTLKTLLSLFSAVGLYPSAQFRCLRNPFAAEIQLDESSVSPLLVARLARDELCCVYQFLFVLGVQPSAPASLTDLGTSGRGMMLGYIEWRAKRMLRAFRRKAELVLGTK